MVSVTGTRARAGSLLGVLVAAVVIAGCGSSNNSSSAAAQKPAASPGGSSSGGSASGAGSSGLSISTTTGTDGTYLTGASGRAIYLWVADKHGKSVCNGACASAWPPVLAGSMPTASSGVNAKDLALTPRSGGAKQVTYNGHPLYYFAGDSGSGSVTGQGSNGFGAKWWLVAPDGSAITKAAAASSSSSGAGSGGGGGYGY
jgi:predicted lipoprotein with Yx(FWY)xxD motif